MDYNIIEDIFKIYATNYKKVGDYSVTELIDPPRVVALNRRYPECSATVEMLRSTASLVGTGVHKYIENLLKPYSSKYELEKRVAVDIMGRKISGTPDILTRSTSIDMFDIKTCKTWKLIFDPEMGDWHKQLNMYVWMLAQNGTFVESINTIAVYLDWMEGASLRSKGYPKAPMVVYPLDKWDDDVTKDYLYKRVALHVAHEEIEDDQLPACTPEERWERFPEGVTEKYAVMKNPSAKRAVRVFTDKEETIQYCYNNGIPSDGFVEIRYAVRKRCDKYCPVNVKCNHYKAYCEDVVNDTLNDIIPIDVVKAGRWN